MQKTSNANENFSDNPSCIILVILCVSEQVQFVSSKTGLDTGHFQQFHRLEQLKQLPT